MIFEESEYRTRLIDGDLIGAIEYIKRFKDKEELYYKYIDLFENGNYLKLTVDSHLNEILIIYQRYLINIFYLKMNKDIALEKMILEFKEFFSIKRNIVSFDEIEENEIENSFKEKGYYFLAGITDAYYGPYIWKESYLKEYDVELPFNKVKYSVRINDGFIFRGYLSFLSFNKYGTGGWVTGSEPDVISCVKSAWDLDSDSFKVSLLKHEAQHCVDKKTYKNISSEELEYRAKLVELIYSNHKDTFLAFISEGNKFNENNHHILASNRILNNFKNRNNNFNIDTISIDEIKNLSLILLKEDNEFLKLKNKEKIISI